MKLITRDTDYAIRALCCFARNRRDRVSVSEMVKELKISRPFLRKILQVLNKKGLLKSYKGQGGGFNLRIKPSKISLIDIIEIFQGRVKINECTFNKKVCPNIKTCKIKKKIDGIQKHVVSELMGIRLDSLIKKGG